MHWKNEWQVTDYRSLNSHGTQFHFFFLIPAAKIDLFFHFYCTKANQIKAVLELQSFITLHFLFVHSFSTHGILHLFPSNGVFLGNRVQQSFKNQRTHKVRSYQSCSPLNGNKLAVTF